MFRTGRRGTALLRATAGLGVALMLVGLYRPGFALATVDAAKGAPAAPAATPSVAAPTAAPAASERVRSAIVPVGVKLDKGAMGADPSVLFDGDGTTVFQAGQPLRVRVSLPKGVALETIGDLRREGRGRQRQRRRVVGGEADRGARARCAGRARGALEPLLGESAGRDIGAAARHHARAGTAGRGAGAGAVGQGGAVRAAVVVARLGGGAADAPPCRRRAGGRVACDGDDRRAAGRSGRSRPAHVRSRSRAADVRARVPRVRARGARALVRGRPARQLECAAGRIPRRGRRSQGAPGRGDLTRLAAPGPQRAGVPRVRPQRSGWIQGQEPARGRRAGRGQPGRAPADRHAPRRQDRGCAR